MREHEWGVNGSAEVRKERKSSLINTALLTCVWYVGSDLLNNLIIRHTPIEDGCGMSENERRELFNKPRTYLMEAIVAAPILEETVFRKIPDLLLRRKADNPLSAVATSAIFAGVHNIKTDGTGGYETKKVPLQEFTDGLLYWYMYKKRGILHSMVAHATSNALVFADNHLYKKMPRKK